MHSNEPTLVRNALDPEGLKHLLIHDASHIDELGETVPEGNGWYYQVILSLITNLEFGETEAQKQYHSIIQHKRILSAHIKRDVGFRVACLDYLLNIDNRMINPKVVEVEHFEQLLERVKQDPKIGCYNFPFFCEMAEIELQKIMRHGGSLAVLMLDFDNFKQLNDLYGHLVADRVLKYGAQSLEKSLRLEDVCARYGGDEFICLLPHTDAAGVAMLTERIGNIMADCDVLSSPKMSDIQLTLSGGAAVYPGDGETVEQLIDAADQRLYEAKRQGKNRILCPQQAAVS